MYSAGRTVVPVWPTWCSLPMKPLSTAARLAPTAPPMAPARSWISLKLSLLPTPAAAGHDHAGALEVHLARLDVPLDQLHGEQVVVELDLLVDDLALRAADRVGCSGITPSRTVAICGHWS